jgi:hypothetical protein
MLAQKVSAAWNICAGFAAGLCGSARRFSTYRVFLGFRN